MVDKKPAILHIVSTLERGGAETVTLDLVRALNGIGTRNTVVCVGGRAGELEADYALAGASIVILDWPRRPVQCMTELTLLATTIRPHAVISNLSLPSAVFLLPFWIKGVSLRISRIHSDSDGRPDLAIVRLKRFVLRSLLQIVSTQILAVSPAALAYAGGRGRVLGNGVNTDEYRFAEIDEGDRCYAINVGRPEEAKNRRRLLPISEELTRRGHPPIRVIGRPGFDLGSGDEPTIEFVGPVSPIRPEYEGAGCLVVVSTREGLPGVVLEALACGVPVVSSRLSGVEMLAMSVKGITIVDLDEPDSTWADAIMRAFEVRRSAEASLISSSVRHSEFTLSSVTALWVSELRLNQSNGRAAGL